MDINFEDVGIGVLIGFLIAVCLMAFTGTHRNSFEAEAVEQGHAEYYLDENNERQWRWVDQPHGGKEGGE